MVLEILLQFDSGRPIFGARFPGLLRLQQYLLEVSTKMLYSYYLLQPLHQIGDFVTNSGSCSLGNVDHFSQVSGLQVVNATSFVIYDNLLLVTAYKF